MPVILNAEMPGSALHLAALLAVLCPLPGAEAIKPDTARMSSHFAGVRGQNVLTQSQFDRLQAEYLAWIDVRMRARVSIQEMNRELDAAGMIAKEDPNALPIEQNHTGYLAELSTADVHNSADILALDAAFITNASCGVDTTLVLYDRSTLKRVALIRAEPSFTAPWNQSGLAVGTAAGQRARLIATGWYLSNCTSTWNGARIRLDSWNGSALHPLLNRSVVARSGNEEWAFKADVQSGMVVYRYVAGMSNAEVMARPAVARFKVAGARVIRQAPVALTRGGFVDEWLRMDDAGAARWSEPSAAAMHRTAAAHFHGGVFTWNSVARCAAGGGSWEIGLRKLDDLRTYYFLMRGEQATAFRMLGVSRSPVPACKPIEGDASVIAAVTEEIPW
jgi:hypothetical protein